MRTFKLWAGGDAHVSTDLARANRRSLADAILQAEQGGTDGGPPFEWDIMLDIGDLSGSQTPPDDEEGEEVVRQYSAAADVVLILIGDGRFTLPLNVHSIGGTPARLIRK